VEREAGGKEGDSPDQDFCLGLCVECRNSAQADYPRRRGGLDKKRKAKQWGGKRGLCVSGM